VIRDIVVTGESWIGKGVPSVESVLRSLLRRAEDEIQWTMYSVSNEARPMLELLEAQIIRGTKVTLAVNQFSKQPAGVRNHLQRLLKGSPHFRLYDFAPADEYAKLHAKVLIVDRKVALVGSANVSRGGFLRNHEIGVLVRDKTAAHLALVFDRLISNGTGTVKIKPSA
jgi:phosphatidylserine/phosphatidylglycerophosphate/cardiolipin synthase-like enzyme